MIRTSIRVCAFALCSSVLLLAGCSGSRSDTLNTQNIGRSDAAAIVEEDAEVDAEVDPDGGEDGGVQDDGDGMEGEGLQDAGDFDVIVSEQVADTGPAPDTTVVVETPLCGNGTVDAEEQCDEGSGNSDTRPGACRTNCRRAHCGDGVVDEGESCDQGARNSDSEANACRTSCRAARCGDNVVDQGEQCDSGDARSDSAAGACRLSCRSARCGDGVTDTDEGCDDGNQVDTDMCRNSCSSARCGDRVRDPEEECDEGGATATCRANCRAPRCGDRVIDAARGEECDDGNTVENDGCRSNCRNGCTADAGCSDGLFCTGTERCLNGVCMPGVGINPDDGIACTVDVCREDLDRVTHTADDARCTPPGPTCSGARGTTSTASCDVTRGCVVRSTSAACSDTASVCQRRGDGSFTLLTYTPACGNTMSCGAPASDSEVCAHIAASCNNRVFTGRADATCDPNAETCGNATPATEDCRRRDSATCSADNRTFTRTTGTCSASGCGTNTSPAETCPDPQDSCSAATLTTYEPTCSSSGCGAPAGTPRACPLDAARACSAFGPNRQDALRTFRAACNAAGTACNTAGEIASTDVCPTSASSCDNTSTRIPRETFFTPLCDTATSCSPTGRSTTRDCTARTTTSCGNTGTGGRAQLTRYVPDCESGARCFTDGRPVATDCPTPTGQCVNLGQTAVFTGFAPACDTADSTRCLPEGRALDPVACISVPVTCSGGNEIRPTGGCNTTTGCTTRPTSCAQRTERTCVAGNATAFTTRSYNGTCTAGEGCAVSTGSGSCGSFCGTVPGLTGLQVCSASTCTGAAGSATCQPVATSCRACATSCALCQAAAVPGGVIVSPGGIVSPSPGGTTGPILTVAPGAGLVSQ